MKNNVKILILDIETSPLVSYSWGPKWQTNLIEVIEQSKVLSYSAKWLKGKQTTKGLPDFKGYKRGKIDDKNIVREIWKLLNECDIAVLQNGNSYDLRVLNSRFMYYGLRPPAPTR